MVSKLILHTGTPKTGTTALQKFLHDRRRMLSTAGWGYPDFLNRSNHRMFSLPFLRPTTTTWHQLNGITDDSIADAKIEWLDEQLSAAPARDKWIISTEHFTKTVRKPASIARAMSFLRSHFDEIEVVVYVRRQDFLLPSVYSQAIKAGRSDPWDWEFFKSKLEDSDYLQLCQDWTAQEGVDSFSIRPFLESYKKSPQSLINDFISVAGLPEEVSKDVKPPRKSSGEAARANYGLSAEGTAFLRLVNPLLPRLSEGQSNMKQRGELIAAVSQLTPGSSMGLSQDLRDLVMEQVAESNGAFIDEYGADLGWGEWLSQEWRPGARPEIAPERIVELMCLVSKPGGPMDWRMPVDPTGGGRAAPVNKLMGKLRRSVSSRT